ncbi:hypothetical protein Hanom_Chr10g00916411 [Helianthus anomalus]
MKQKCVNNTISSTSCVEEVSIADWTEEDDEPSCADDSSNDSAEVSTISSDKPELSDSIKADDMEDEVKTDVVQSKQKEPKRAVQRLRKENSKHQRQSHSLKSSTGSNHPQKDCDLNFFVKPVNNGKCEKYAFYCANKALGKTYEISKQDLQSRQQKKKIKRNLQNKRPLQTKSINIQILPCL